VECVKAAFAELPQDLTDGVRIEFDGGWALCRPSVTEPAVTIRVEGQSRERMDGIAEEVLRHARADGGLTSG
jgi:phosphomannomutase/phosphomannomutase/phosphoglucomutase